MDGAYRRNQARLVLQEATPVGQILVRHLEVIRRKVIRDATYLFRFQFTVVPLMNKRLGWGCAIYMFNASLTCKMVIIINGKTYNWNRFSVLRPKAYVLLRSRKPKPIISLMCGFVPQHIRPVGSALSMRTDQQTFCSLLKSALHTFYALRPFLVCCNNLRKIHRKQVYNAKWKTL